MKAIKVYTQNEKFYMEDLENNQIVELNERVDDGKTLKLPENSANRKYCSVEKAMKGIVLDYKEAKTLGPREGKNPSEKSQSKAPKLNELVELLTEDEYKIYKGLMDKAAERLARKKKYDELIKLREELEKLEAELGNEVEG